MTTHTRSQTHFSEAVQPAIVRNKSIIQFSKTELEAMNSWPSNYNRHHHGAWILRDDTRLSSVDGVVIRDAANTCRIEIFKMARDRPLFKIKSPIGEYESTQFPQIMIRLHHCMKELTPLVFKRESAHDPAQNCV